MQQKRQRRNSDQLLTDTIGELYKRIQERISEVKDKEQALEDVFDSLRPLRELEQEYRGTE